jgi:hypothetical protein
MFPATSSFQKNCYCNNLSIILQWEDLEKRANNSGLGSKKYTFLEAWNMNLIQEFSPSFVVCIIIIRILI